MNARRLTLLRIAALLSSVVISESGSGTDRPPGTIQLHGAGLHFPPHSIRNGWKNIESVSLRSR
jgi:hypothetical protein